MGGHTDQLIGALFRVLRDEGHGEAQQLLLETYQRKAVADREELAQNLFVDCLTVLNERLDAETEADVLTTAIQYLGNRLTAVIEAVPIAIVVVDTDGAIQLWNDGAARMFGWSEAEMRHQQYPDCLTASLDVTDSFGDRLRSGESLAGIEAQHRHRNGSVLDVRVWAAPLQGSDAGFSGATFAISDITAQKQREQRLSVLNRVLRHNIRTDINVIQGHLSMLADELPDDNSHVDVMEQRLGNITELSEAARHIDQLDGDAEAGVTTTDLATLVDERLGRLEADHPSAVVTATVPETAPAVAHDLLAYALDNVLENAVVHNLSSTPHVDVTVSEPTPDDDYRTIRIADDGPGLPALEREVLTSDTETPLSHSSGVGLWLTRWIVRSANGRVAVESSSSGGTCIAFRLLTPSESKPPVSTEDTPHS